MVGYFPSLRAVVSHIRQPLTAGIATASNLHQSPQFFANQDLGPFATRDPRFPLPGNMNLDVGLMQEGCQIPESQQSLASAFLEVETNEIKKHRALAMFLNNTEIDERNKEKQSTTSKESERNKESQCKETFNNLKGNVECSVQQCSPSLQRSFSDLFPDMKFKSGELAVISICQRTANDMTSWSQAVQEEREELLENFIDSAKEICELLQSQGYWADFIDPSSGNAYFGGYSNSTFFETDERYNQLGYRVMDLGCCKALSHNLWGTFIYVGSIFTNAPTDSLSLQTALPNKE